MSKYKEGFLKAGEVFKFVHFCAPQNSQEKYAEALNGAFKTTIAHKNHEAIGRWHNKGARRVDQKKVVTAATTPGKTESIIRLKSLWRTTGAIVKNGTIRFTPIKRNIPE